MGEWSAAHSFSTVGKQSAKLSNRVTAPQKSNSSKQAQPSLPLSHRVVCTVSCRWCPAAAGSSQLLLLELKHQHSLHSTAGLVPPPARSRIFQLSPNSTILWLWPLLLDLWWVSRCLSLNLRSVPIYLEPLFPFGASKKKSHLLTAGAWEMGFAVGCFFKGNTNLMQGQLLSISVLLNTSFEWFCSNLFLSFCVLLMHPI